MAKSPAHQFGQELGVLLEEIIKPRLSDFCAKQNLYLDSQGTRGAARKGKKVTWADKYGNDHDLDFVIEKGGSRETRGRPIAFVESAWRRYAKHSKNKAQEIQGAILPITEHPDHIWNAPFKGVILAGVFTEPAIKQLKSSGFVVLYIGHAEVIDGFKAVGLNINFNEETPDADFSKALTHLKKLSFAKRITLKKAIVKSCAKQISAFMDSLEKALSRFVELITVTPLYGAARNFMKVSDAIKFLEKPLAKDTSADFGFLKMEIGIRFSDNTRIDASFRDTVEAVRFIHLITEK